jgi:RimJ/RimL family protein N-acetyltransferase
MIETERLLLRRVQASDFEASHAMWSDPSVAQYISGVASTRQQSWARVLAAIGHWETMAYGPFVVEETATHAFVGEMWLFEHKREITPSIDGVPEAGWSVTPSMQGRGYATEALRGLLCWADAALDAPRTVAVISEANLVSVRVAEKASYREYQRTTLNQKPVILFERPRSRPL